MLWRRKTQRSSSPGVPAGQGADEDAARTTAETTPTAPDAANPSESEDPTLIVSREAQLDHQQQQQPQTKERADVQHFQLAKWNACAFWSWDVMHDTCVICRNGMMSLCIHCQAKIGTSPLDEVCAVAWGVCNHAYHLHCIKRWLESSTHPRCPLDNSEWEFSMVGQ